MGIRSLAPQFPEAFFSTYCQIKFSTVIVSATRTVIMDYMVRREENLWTLPLIQYIRQIIRYLIFPKTTAPIVKNTQSGWAGQPPILITGVLIPSRSAIPFDESSIVKAIPRGSKSSAISLLAAFTPLLVAHCPIATITEAFFATFS